jgi:hypothetical protein
VQNVSSETNETVQQHRVSPDREQEIHIEKFVILLKGER